MLQNTPPWIDWRFDVGVEDNSGQQSELFEWQPKPNQELSDRYLPMIEAQGWIIVGTNGQVILTATPPTVTAERIGSTGLICHQGAIAK